MLIVNIHDAKTNLSSYLSQLDREEEIVGCRRNRPIAVIRPIPSPRGRRAIGLERGRLNVPESFFDPLPEELVTLYDGQNS